MTVRVRTGKAVAGAVVTLIGGIYLAAWLAGAMSHRGFDAITMKTNTAACLLLLGVALLLATEQAAAVRRWFSGACAGLSLVIAVLTLGENLIGFNLGIDQLLATEAPGGMGIVSPNRMGTPAGLCITMIGLAVLLLNRRRDLTSRAIWTVQSLALIVCLISFLNNTGYLYGAHPLYGVASLTAVAWPTAVALLVLGLGLLCTHPEAGIMALLTTDKPGGRVVRRLLVPAILLPIGFGWLRVAGERWGFFDAAMSTALMIIPIIVTFSCLIYFVGRWVNEAAAHLEDQKELLAVTLASIGDGVIVTDAAGRITFLNSEAQRLTGWTLAQAQGQPLTSVFSIISEQTREPVESPVEKVLRLNTVVGLANHTILVAKDGREIPIDDSGAPIRRPDGAIQGVVLVFRDFTEQKNAENALRQAEQRVRHKLDSVLSPEGDIGTLELADIIDVQAIQSLMDDFYRVAQIPMAIIDLQGKVLVGVGWQEICTSFHRVNPETCKHCIESDLQLSAGVAPGEFRLYKCKNNMWDVATPIIIGGKHVGNLFSGQFFFEGEPVQHEQFRTQALRYGFDEPRYMAALQRVPRLSRARLDLGMAYLVKLANLLSQTSYSNLKLARSLAERDALAHKLGRLNRTLKALGASSQAMMRAQTEPEYLAEVCRIIVEDCGHAMVWVGYAQDDDKKTVRPVASAGFEEGYLQTLDVTWADTPRGRGPTGTAIRTGRPSMCRNMLTDPQFEPWREQALKRGYASSVVLPLIAEGKTFGALTIYSREPDPFSPDEMSLLSDLAKDLAYGVAVLRAQSARNQAENALRQNEERYRSLVEMSPDSLLVHRDSLVVFVNSAALQLFGADSPERLIGKPVLELFHPDFRSIVNQRIARLARGETVPLIEEKILRLDGSEVPVEVVASPFRDPQGGAIQVILRDITQRKRTEEERLLLLEAERAARSEVERTNRMKDEFLATVSHELRSPLGAIVGWTGLLAKGKVDVAKATGVIRQSASSLTQLVEDLLDMSRIVSGKIRLKRESVNLAEIVDNVVESVQFSAQAKGIHVAVSFEPALPTLECDPNRIQQIVWNLLTNAIKFTPQGGLILVTASQNRGRVILRVQDNGKGIAPDFLPYVFDRFRQEDGGIARKHGGLGLGLAIVKNLVELHGGQVWAESEGEGKGATFIVCLPHKDAYAEKPSEPSLSQSDPVARDLDEAALQGLKILSVDDDPYWRELTERTLSDFGATVRTADSVREALRVIEEFRPDLLLSDVGMAGEDGFSFIRRLRAAKDWRSQLPCLAVTALSRPEDRERALEVGFDDHVGKPFDPGRLCFSVAQLLKSRKPRND